MYEYDEEQIRQLVGFDSPQKNFQAQQLPQIEQGLLGETPQPNQRQASTAAAQMAQVAQGMNRLLSDNTILERQAANQQMAQQALSQQQQQQAQNAQTLLMLAKLFMGGA